MGKTIKGGSTHEKNIELLTKDQKRFLGGVLKSDTKGAKKAYRDFLKAPKEPDMMSRKELSKMFGPSQKTFRGLMDKKDSERFWDRLSPSRDTYKDVMAGRDAEKIWGKFGPSRDTFKEIMSGRPQQQLWSELAPSRQTLLGLMAGGDDEGAFKTGVVDPMMQQYKQEVLPAIQQRFVDMNAGSSSALNQALASSANDLTTQMGSMYLPFKQSQQQTQLAAAQGLGGMVLPYMDALQQGRLSAASGLAGSVLPYLSELQQGRLSAASGLSGSVLPYMQQSQQARLAGAQSLAGLANPYLAHGSMQSDIYRGALGNRLSALSGLGSLAGQQAFTPLISQQSGILGPLIQAGGKIGAAALSSEKVKENIRDYDKGLDVVTKLDVKNYDYKPEAGGAKNRVGVIAEDVPEEVQGEINGIKAVDLYGLIGLLINSVKQLNEKITKLEAVQ